MHLFPMLTINYASNIGGYCSQHPFFHPLTACRGPSEEDDHCDGHNTTHATSTRPLTSETLRMVKELDIRGPEPEPGLYNRL